ncbi:MOSC domain-containing protein [Hymenobacter terrenus]|uniref:MOSC domain-containing protein n=1 Tax=Hymenobacter terrenus TaxID=1629124 RepID=UPI0006190D25|nr:MOSC domain-containing protein [Hymenobacter terrenus]
MQILSVNIGLPQQYTWRGKSIETSIFKAPTTDLVAVHPEHLAGYGQADLRVHGGPDKAVYSYPTEHYGYWAPYIPAALLTPGAFGENLTTQGLLESEVRVGDCFRAGTAVLIAVQPRMPCFKLGLRLNDEHLVKRFLEARRSGIYFRVVQTGTLRAGDALTLVQPATHAVTIQQVVEAYYAHASEKDAALLRTIVEVRELPTSLKSQFRTMLAATELG